jgi:gluconolactonase
MMRFLIAMLCVLSVGVLAGELEPANEAEFAKIVAKDAKVEKLGGGMKFLEGPAWVAKDGGYLLFSDIPANEIKKWTAKDGVTTFRSPCNNTNGHFIGLDGLLYSCEHSARRISRTEEDGKVTTVVDAFDGKKLSSPNDLVMKSDGTIWFTDPPYGVPKGEKKEQESNNVYRFDPKTKAITAVIKDCDMPNGLTFSPDEKKLYVADSGKPRHIRVFDVNADGTVANGKVFCAIDKGGPDGIRTDTEGRLWSSAGDGVQIFGADGALIGRIHMPPNDPAKPGESPANLCFGGDDMKTLYVTARTGLYAVKVLVAGKK